MTGERYASAIAELARDTILTIGCSSAETETEKPIRRAKSATRFSGCGKV